MKISQKEHLMRKPSIRQMKLKKRKPIYVILDNIRSLYNVGAMFRTADAVLVKRIFLTGITGVPPNKSIDKSALGATSVVPWEYRDDTRNLVLDLKSQGIYTIALELTHHAVPYFKTEYKFPICLIVGNEVDGISQEVLDVCDQVIDIPMLGRATSLNVATAFGIAIFNIAYA